MTVPSLVLGRTRRSARTSLLVGLLATLAIGSSGVADAASLTPLGFNFVTNPGGELGAGGSGEVLPVPTWKKTSTFTVVKYGTVGYPSTVVRDAANGQVNFMFCGLNTSASVARQRIAISGQDALIDSAGLTLSISVRIGATGTEGDRGQMIVTYLNAAGAGIGTLKTATVTNNDGQMVRTSADGLVPAGTRAVRVALQGKGFVGTTCDVYFDNVSVKLVAVAP